MKRGYLWVDWVELGCRGWEIDETGAGLYYDDGQACHEDCYAHMDRTTLHITCVGCRTFYARVLNDVLAAGLLKRVRTTTGTTNTYTHGANALAVSRFDVWWAQSA